MLAPAPLVLADRRRVGSVTAELVLNRLLARPGARLGRGRGRPPADMFAALRAHAAAGELPSAAATVLALVAYHGSAERLRAELSGIEVGALHDPGDPAARLDEAALDLAVVGLDADG